MPISNDGKEIDTYCSRRNRFRTLGDDRCRPFVRPLKSVHGHARLVAHILVCRVNVLNDENPTELSSVFETYWRSGEAEPDFRAIRPVQEHLFRTGGLP
jgi:hypothetical protein